MTHFATKYGSFAARLELTDARAEQLARAGLDVVVLQVEWQGSRLRQRSVAQLQREMEIAAARGLEVWWLAWCLPGVSRPEQLRRKLADLAAQVGTPAGFVADCEVDGGWSPSRPALRPIAAAARDAGMPIVGLTSHAKIGSRWPVDDFEVGFPQLFRQAHVTPTWALECFLTWSSVPCLWPVLGCADPTSDAAAMRADLEALEQLQVRGALWWSARGLVSNNARDKLEAAAPQR